jgi:hypothetical protein
MHVDDGLIVGDRNEVKEILGRLGAKWKMKVLTLEKYAGWDIWRNREKRQVFISQSTYVMSMRQSDRFGNLPLRKFTTPMEPGFNARLDGDKPCIVDKVPYLELIGSLMYMLQTRVDLAYPVNVLACFSHTAQEKHWKAAKRVLAYALQTHGKGISLNARRNESLCGYADASLGMERESRSRTGMMVMYRGSPVSWSSHVQGLVTNSSSEAEYVALNECAREVLFVLGYPQTKPTTIYEDNSSAISISGSKKIAHRSKHIAIRYHATRDYIQKSWIAVKYCPTGEMLADLLTKPLPTSQHQKLYWLMTGINSEGSEMTGVLKQSATEFCRQGL